MYDFPLQSNMNWINENNNSETIKNTNKNLTFIHFMLNKFFFSFI